MKEQIQKLKKELKIQICFSNENNKLLEETFNNLKTKYNSNIKIEFTNKKYPKINKTKSLSVIIDILKKHNIPKINKLSDKELCKFLDSKEGRKYYIKIINKYKINTDNNWKYFYNNYISMDTLSELENKELIFFKYKNKLFKLICFSDSLNNNKETITKIYKRLYSLYSIGFFCFDGEIKLWLSTTKKKISDRNKVLTFKNINSGMCAERQYINIWREEEALKVAVHEYMHLTQFDFCKNTMVERYFSP